MIWFITALLALLCVLGALISLRQELKQKKNTWSNNDDLSSSRWTSIDPGPDSLYPVKRENEEK